MAKPKLKVSNKLNQELNKTIRNFNQKISRLEKQGRDLELPSKITKKDLINDVSSRQELKRQIKQLQRFSRKGSEATIVLNTGERISVWEKNEFIIQKRTATAKLTKKIKDLESKQIKIAGKKQAGTFATMGDSNYLNLVEKRNRIRSKKFEDLTKKDIERYKSITRKILKITDNSVFKESYKTMMLDVAHTYGINKDKVDIILDKLDDLKESSFTKLFTEDKAIKSIIDYYLLVKKQSDDFTPEIETYFDEVYANIDEIVKEYS